MSTLPELKKRRRTIKSSLTRLDKNVREAAGKTSETKTRSLLRHYSKRLSELSLEFKENHEGIVNLTEEEDDLSAAQEVLDEHDDRVAFLTTEIEELSALCSPSATVSADSGSIVKVAKKQLVTVRKRIEQLVTNIDAAATTSHLDVPLLRHEDEQLSDAKTELKDIATPLLALDLPEDHEVEVELAALTQMRLECSLKLRRLLMSSPPAGPTPAPVSVKDSSGVKLPKISVPTFDGNLLHWRSFWEQFSVSVHDRDSLSNTEKLVYLQQSLKDGSAKGIIEGLSHTGADYDEAVESLRVRYNRPRLIHQAHIKVILEAPKVKDGTGKELRRLHDEVQQHLRALRSMGYEPSGAIITSILELKLDPTTLFEWQRESQTSTSVPHFSELMKFIDLRAQASETSNPEKKQHRQDSTPRPHKLVPSHVAHTNPGTKVCIACNTDKHQLYSCPKFRALPHDQKVTLVKDHSICMNCLRPGHFVRQCQSQHKCKECQRSHHSLLHVSSDAPSQQKPADNTNTILSHTTTGISPDALLMTCQVMIGSPNGSVVKARALLDSGSSASFVSERLAQSLCLPRSPLSATISGVAGITHTSPVQSLATFTVSSTQSPEVKFDVTAVVVPRVTCILPQRPISLKPEWKHLTDLKKADPHFGTPGKIDLLLGVDIFVASLRSGRKIGPSQTPIAIETVFGWVLAGRTDTIIPPVSLTSCHVSLLTGDNLLRQFWEIEDCPSFDEVYSAEEQQAICHFKETHFRVANGRFCVSLLKKPTPQVIGESRSQAVRRFLSLERTLYCKSRFKEFSAAVQEYFDMNHAELVPRSELDKPPQSVFYLPMHAVYKESSTTTKLRVVFDASAKSASGISLNDTLVIGPTVHSSLVDVLLRFRLHRVAIVADISRMYRAVELTPSDRDLHRFVWRNKPDETLKDFRMTRLTFGVSASSFLANMCVKQNAHDFSHIFPLASAAVESSFYVDDCLTGADSLPNAIQLRRELQDLSQRGGFLLRKWNSSDPAVLQDIPADLKDVNALHSMPSPDTYTKTLGVEWNTRLDHFRLTVSSPPKPDDLTKRTLISDVARTFDVLGWFSPATIKLKILFQRLWELKLEWDDAVPLSVKTQWLKWRTELPLLANCHIARCYFPTDSFITSWQLHGFSDASELAFAGVVYLRMIDTNENVHVTLVTSKTKVAPIKHLSIPRLELCGAQLLARLLYHVQQVLRISSDDLYAWSDSTIVLSWLDGNPKRFKTYVGNRISSTTELIPPRHWRHVSGHENPADCASRGMFPSELIDHTLWWNGPEWLHLQPSEWPEQLHSPPVPSCEDKVSFHSSLIEHEPILPPDRFSSFNTLKRVTAWIMRFVGNCRSSQQSEKSFSSCLTVIELSRAEEYWIKFAQADHFSEDIQHLLSNKSLPKSSCLIPLHPFLDSENVLRVGGREHHSQRVFVQQHPAILHGSHHVTKLIIHSEHLRLLHAGPTLLFGSLSRRFHIVCGRKIIRTVTRSCVVCRRLSAPSQSQLVGRLPIERVTPGLVFERVGIDYAGPFQIKSGAVRRPILVKAYVCVFVSLSVRAIHLELVSSLSTEAFIACLRRFISRRGKPSLIWSDHGSNFVGASRELKEMIKFLEDQVTQKCISEFCSSQGIQWKFIPEHAPHFGGLWEAAVKSMKTHLRRIVSTVSLRFEELYTVLTQIEACLNSRPLASLPNDDDGIEVLTPGHFLVGRPLEALPDPSDSYHSMSTLSRWHLCQALVRNFWRHWSDEYVQSLRRYYKNHEKRRNVQEGDVVVLREDNMLPTKWPTARVVETFPGADGLVRTVRVKTSSGIYTRPIVKMAVLVPNSDN